MWWRFAPGAAGFAAGAIDAAPPIEEAAAAEVAEQA
jgi:hypothetical protein